MVTSLPLASVSSDVIAMVALPPQSKVTTPPLVSARTSACSVQLLAVPVPTTVVGRETSVAWMGAAHTGAGGGGTVASPTMTLPSSRVPPSLLVASPRAPPSVPDALPFASSPPHAAKISDAAAARPYGETNLRGESFMPEE